MHVSLFNSVSDTMHNSFHIYFFGSRSSFILSAAVFQSPTVFSDTHRAANIHAELVGIKISYWKTQMYTTRYLHNSIILPGSVQYIKHVK